MPPYAQWVESVKLYAGDTFISYKKPLSHERGSERSKRASERSGGCERSEQSGASEQVGGARERANGRASGPVLNEPFPESFGPLSRTTKNPDSRWQYWAARSSVSLYARTAYSFTCPARFTSALHCAHSFVHSLTPDLVGKVNDFALTSGCFEPEHRGANSGRFETSNPTLSHELGSERSERASERAQRSARVKRVVRSQ